MSTVRAAAAIIATWASSVALGAPYTVTSLDYPGYAGTTMVNGINDAGVIVGDFSVPNTATSYGFARVGRSYAILPSVPCTTAYCETSALAINSRGDVAGEYADNIAHRAVFLISGGVLHQIAMPGGSRVALFGGLNERGDVAGYYQTSRGVIHMFLYRKGSLTDIPAPADFVDVTAKGINNGGEITGAYDDAHGLHGFIDKNGRFSRFDFPGGSNTSPEAINEPGDVVGSYTLAGKGGQLSTHGFLLSHGNFSAIDYPGGTDTSPSVITNNRTVAGIYTDPRIAAPFNTRAFVRSGAAFTTLPLPGAALSVSAVSSSGSIVGTYYDASCPVNCRIHGFIAAPGHP